METNSPQDSQVRRISCNLQIDSINPNDYSIDLMYLVTTTVIEYHQKRRYEEVYI
jgi:hypothetical protein